jgi:hypothetical protein
VLSLFLVGSPLLGETFLAAPEPDLAHDALGRLAM